MSLSLKDLFKTNINTNSVKNNTIKVETKTDIMYDIARKLGKIDANVEYYNQEIKKINTKLNSFNSRLIKLEKEIYKKNV